MSVSDQTPIFITRLVDESGCRMTGGLADGGELPALGREALLDELPGPDQVGVLVEQQHHLRQAEDRLRADRLDARRCR